MRVTCFGSGSDGNALLVQTDDTSILIDSGVPVRMLRSGLRLAGVHDGELSAVLISHEHHDHIRSAPQIARYQPVPYFGTNGTIGRSASRLEVDWYRMQDGITFAVGALEVTPVAVSHDAEEPVGFLIRDARDQIAVFTDLGEANGDVASAIQGSSLVVLESNYDEEMLRLGPYPIHLKRRIRGPLGHLGNDACASLLADNIDHRTRDVWLAHLSRKNNRPDIATEAAKAVLGAGNSAPRIIALPRVGKSAGWDSATAAQRPWQSTLF